MNPDFISAEAIRSRIKAYFDSLATMNAQAWADNFTEDGIVYDPVGNPPSRAQETASQFFGLLSTVFDRLDLSQDQVFVSGQGAAVKWTMRGTAKNGKQGIAEGISTFEIDASGKIQQVASYWDDRAMMAQLKD